MYLDRIIPFTMPTKIIHGFGSMKLIPEECKRLGIKKAILVTDEGLVKAGVIKEVTAILDGGKDTLRGLRQSRRRPFHENGPRRGKTSSGGRMRRSHHRGRWKPALRREGDCSGGHEWRKDS